MKALTNLFLLTSIFIFLLVSCGNDDTEEKQASGALTAELISNSDCKGLKSANNGGDNTPDSLSCVNYSFNRHTNILAIQHINAGFNCCPDRLGCDAVLKNDTIIIQEYEINGYCDCNCLYDLEIKLTGIEAKNYMVKFVEPYIGENKEIYFEIDLADNNTGSYCVNRKRYPWGVGY